jgi:hypothetical protein
VFKTRFSIWTQTLIVAYIKCQNNSLKSKSKTYEVFSQMIINTFTLLCAIWDNNVNLKSRVKVEKKGIQNLTCLKKISIPSYIHSYNFFVCF